MLISNYSKLGSEIHHIAKIFFLSSYLYNELICVFQRNVSTSYVDPATSRVRVIRRDTPGASCVCGEFQHAVIREFAWTSHRSILKKPTFANSTTSKFAMAVIELRHFEEGFVAKGSQSLLCLQVGLGFIFLSPMGFISHFSAENIWGRAGKILIFCCVCTENRPFMVALLKEYGDLLLFFDFISSSCTKKQLVSPF